MDIEYAASGSFQKRAPVNLFYNLPKELDDKMTMAHVEKQFGSNNDRERPPAKRPGDTSIILGAIVGIIAGGAAAGIIIALMFGVMAGVFASVGGAVAGGIIGTISGPRIAKRRATN